MNAVAKNRTHDLEKGKAFANHYASSALQSSVRYAIYSVYLPSRKANHSSMQQEHRVI